MQQLVVLLFAVIIWVSLNILFYKPEQASEKIVAHASVTLQAGL